MVYSDDTFLMVSSECKERYFTFIVNGYIDNAVKSLELLDDTVTQLTIAYSMFDWSDEEEVISCYQAMQRTLYEKAFFKELPVDLYMKNTVGLFCVGSGEPQLAFTKNVDDEFLNTVANTLLCPNESKS